MKRGIKLSLKIIGGVVATLLVLTVAAVFTLNTSWCQQKVLNYAVSLLEERLQTKVEIDSGVRGVDLSAEFLLALNRLQKTAPYHLETVREIFLQEEEKRPWERR